MDSDRLNVSPREEDEIELAASSQYYSDANIVTESHPELTRRAHISPFPVTRLYYHVPL